MKQKIRQIQERTRRFEQQKLHSESNSSKGLRLEPRSRQLATCLNILSQQFLGTPSEQVSIEATTRENYRQSKGRSARWPGSRLNRPKP